MSPDPSSWHPRTPPPGGRPADRPGPGQESVWDYPRPPAVRATTEEVVVELGGTVVAVTRRPLQVLETSHPPTYYVPLDDILPGSLVPVEGRITVCEFKGAARYLDVVGEDPHGGTLVARQAGWTYPEPRAGFEALLDHVAFYPGRMTRCTVDGEIVRPQEGHFYGGWMTSRVVGPFKGGPGSNGW